MGWRSLFENSTIEEVLREAGATIDRPTGIFSNRCEATIEGFTLVVELDVSTNFARLRIPIAPPLDLGLEATPRGGGYLEDGIATVTGDEKFDRDVLVFGDEGHRIRSLLDEPLRRMLTELATLARFSVDDSSIHAEPRFWDVREVVPKMAEISQRIADARKSLPPRGLEAGPREQLGVVATRHGLRYRPEERRLDGESDLWVARGEFRRTPQKCLEIVFELRFLRGLDQRIAARGLVRPRLFDRFAKWRSRGLGDADFDRRFLTVGRSRERLLDIVDAEVRRRLLACLARADEVRFDDLGLLVRAPYRDETQRAIAELVDQACLAANRIVHNVHGAKPGSAGPLR